MKWPQMARESLGCPQLPHLSIMTLTYLKLQKQRWVFGKFRQTPHLDVTLLFLCQYLPTESLFKFDLSCCRLGFANPWERLRETGMASGDSNSIPIFKVMQDCVSFGPTVSGAQTRIPGQAFLLGAGSPWASVLTILSFRLLSHQVRMVPPHPQGPLLSPPPLTRFPEVSR